MSILTAAPDVFKRFFDANGAPLAGGLLTTRIAGLSTLQTVWQDSAGTVPWSNPIVLDSQGFVPGVIYPPITPAIKYTLTTSTGVSVGPTYDNIIASAPSS